MNQESYISCGFSRTSRKQVSKLSHINIALFCCISFHYFCIHTHQYVWTSDHSVWAIGLRVTREIRRRRIVDLLYLGLNRLDSSHVSMWSSNRVVSAVLFIALETKCSSAVGFITRLLVVNTIFVTIWCLCDWFFVLFFALLAVTFLFAVIFTRSYTWLGATHKRFGATNVWFLFAQSFLA